jgi:hypothetical protein
MSKGTILLVILIVSLLLFLSASSQATTYQWHTFYGSDNDDVGGAIAVDGSGNVYIAGRSAETWQGIEGANPLHPHGGNGDIMVLKLDSSGAYQWHTFYGSNGSDYGAGITVDGSEYIYVAGGSYATWQGDGGRDPLHAHSWDDDIAVLKLNGSGAYLWHTFYGSSDESGGTGIEVDQSGNVYVAGYSWETWQGDGGSNPLHAYSGGGYRDIAILKLSDPKSVTVLSSNGGEIFDTSSTYTIEWEAATQAVKFKLFYSVDKGVTWNKLHAQPYVTGSSYDWMVQPVPTHNERKCLLKIIGYDEKNKKVGSDRSDAPFTIVIVELTAPNGGDPLVSGSTVDITWRKNKTWLTVTKVVLSYTTNGGVTWKPIATLKEGDHNTPGDYTHSWTVPSVGTIPKTKCKVKVFLKDADGNTLRWDTSDAYFTINPAP